MDVGWVGGGEDVEFEDEGGRRVEGCDEGGIGRLGGAGSGGLGGRGVFWRGHYVGLVGWDG